MTSDTLNPCPLIQPPSTGIQSLECGPGSGCHPALCPIEQNNHPDRSRRQNPGAVALGAPTNPRPRRGQLPPARPRRRHIRPRRHVRRADHRARPHRPRAPVPPRRNPDGGFRRIGDDSLGTETFSRPMSAKCRHLDGKPALSATKMRLWCRRRDLAELLYRRPPGVAKTYSQS